MTSVYGLLLGASGLSQAEAAAFHGVRPDTVKSWVSGRRGANAGARRELAELVERQRDAAEELVEQALDLAGDATEIEIGLAGDDTEARSAGWPCAGAQHRTMALAAAALTAEGYEVIAGPRGATLATAGAADQTERR